MKEIKRYEINEVWAHSGIIKAGDFCFLNWKKLLKKDLMGTILYASRFRQSLLTKKICCFKSMV